RVTVGLHLKTMPPHLGHDYLQPSCIQIKPCSNISAKTITLRNKDPDYITPLVRSLLSKWCKLWLQGRIAEANAIADKINKLIAKFRQTCLGCMGNTTSAQLWRARIMEE